MQKINEILAAELKIYANLILSTVYSISVTNGLKLVVL